MGGFLIDARTVVRDTANITGRKKGAKIVAQDSVSTAGGRIIVVTVGNVSVSIRRARICALNAVGKAS